MRYEGFTTVKIWIVIWQEVNSVKDEEAFVSILKLEVNNMKLDNVIAVY